MNHTSEKSTDPLTLLLYPATGSGESSLYEDAGDGFAYRDGDYARRSVSCETSESHVTVRIGEREGSFTPERREILLELHCVHAPESVQVDGEEVSYRHDEEKRRITISLEESSSPATVEVRL
jgi:alpha-glucosidase